MGVIHPCHIKKIIVRLLSVLRFIPASTANDLRLRSFSIPDLIHYIFIPILNFYLFYNDYETSYTTYINHARWHRCLCSDGLRVGFTGHSGFFPHKDHLKERFKLYLLFYYLFTTITKQVIQLILIMLVGTDVCVQMVFVWEET